MALGGIKRFLTDPVGVATESGGAQFSSFGTTAPRTSRQTAITVIPTVNTLAPWCGATVFVVGALDFGDTLNGGTLHSVIAHDVVGSAATQIVTISRCDVGFASDNDCRIWTRL